jgi:adenine-specific DNA-methyltransferase
MTRSEYNDWTKEDLVEEIRKLKKRKKFGLVWETKEENILTGLEEQIPLLQLVKEKCINVNKSDLRNVLIEGDNLHALAILSFTHKRKVDIIYIDPPYNTGENDFKYNDNYVDREDAYRHSKWLSFMTSRLRLSKDLLKEDGVIFVSIGIQEQSHLRMLMDEIFGESNFIAMISRVQKSGSAQGTHFAPSIDYVLCYAFNKSVVAPFSQPFTEQYLTGFKLIDEEGRKYKTKELYQSSLDPMRGCINQRYFIEAPDGSLIIPPGENFPTEAKDGAQISPVNRNDKVWRWSQGRYQEERKNLIFKKSPRSSLVDQNGKQSNWAVYTRQYLKAEGGTLPRDFLDEFENSQGTAALKQLDLHFTFAKPVGLISHLIEITNKNNPVVLDYFAGSGTTGEAVLTLNRQDGGNRKFILITNNEGQIMDEVCHPRIKKLITGYKNKKGDTLPSHNASAYFFKTTLTSAKKTDANSKKICNQIIGTLQLKEECFDVVEAVDLSYYIYKNSAKSLTIILDPDTIDTVINSLIKHELPGVAYIFSLGNDDYAEEFEIFKGRIQTQPVPQSLLNAYQLSKRVIKLKS